MELSATHSVCSLTRSLPLGNVDSFAPAHLAPEGAALGTLPRGYPRRLGALRANLQLLYLALTLALGCVLGGQIQANLLIITYKDFTFNVKITC